MARPIKAPEDARTKRAKFRATEAEMVQLEQMAADAGQTVSDYLRVRALAAEPIRPKATPDRAALIAALGPLGFIRSDLIHVRSDINQILKDRWAYTFIKPERVETAFQQIETALAKIEGIADHVHNALENDR